MRPQFFPWLFDDRNAWEKSLADPRYSYELPIENFMAIYQIERKLPDGTSASSMALPSFSPMMSQAPMPMASFAPMPVAAAAPASAPAKDDSKRENGILSQDEIDALLSGL